VSRVAPAQKQPYHEDKTATPEGSAQTGTAGGTHGGFMPSTKDGNALVITKPKGKGETPGVLITQLP
jgi:hypothetical protein